MWNRRVTELSSKGHDRGNPRLRHDVLSGRLLAPSSMPEVRQEWAHSCRIDGGLEHRGLNIFWGLPHHRNGNRKSFPIAAAHLVRVRTNACVLDLQKSFRSGANGDWNGRESGHAFRVASPCVGGAKISRNAQLAQPMEFRKVPTFLNEHLINVLLLARKFE